MQSTARTTRKRQLVQEIVRKWFCEKTLAEDGQRATRQLSRRTAGRSTSVGRQPGKPGWLATVVNLTGGTARRLELAERSGRQPGRSAT